MDDVINVCPIVVPLDYEQVSGDGIFEFNANQSFFNVSIRIVNDNIFELTEQLLANLSFVGSPPAHVTIISESAKIIILDDEGIPLYYRSNVAIYIK